MLALPVVAVDGLESVGPGVEHAEVPVAVGLVVEDIVTEVGLDVELGEGGEVEAKVVLAYHFPLRGGEA